MRGLTLLVTVVIAVYLTILIANGGGYVDQMRIGQIREQVILQMGSDPEMALLTVQQRKQLEEERVRVRGAAGLGPAVHDQEFRVPVEWTNLNLGSAEYLLSDSGSRQVRNILGERLPSTLLLMGTSQLLLFFCALFVALFLSRRYGSFLDKLVIALAPNSAAPAWFYGLFLILIFAALLGWLPYGGMIDAPPPQEPLPRALSIAKHMILPVLSMFIANIFASIYSWRTFFLIYSSEDYVEMAKAKGLSDRQIERRYVLRPTLPTIITSFS